MTQAPPTDTIAAATQALTPTPFRSPVQFLAFGFGSGLARRAPGTMGTLVAVPLYWLIGDLSLVWYSVVLLIAAAAGVFICDRASHQLGVHDHPGIVWDEFVGYGVTMWALPATWQWMLAGFLVFRIFDVAKPWPIGPLDKKVQGGFGIMVDDIVAGVMGCAVLHAVLWLVRT